jgi:anthranilate synthase component 1
MKFQEIPYGNPLDFFSKLTEEYDYLYLLESVEGPKKLAQFSFIGFNPKKLIRVKNSIIEIIEGKKRSEIKSADPLEIIKKSIQNNRISFDKFRFIGGAVGYISYDAIRYWEDLPCTSKDDLNLHDIEMGIYDD